MATALRYALRRILPENVQVWAYDEDFDELWRLLDIDQARLPGSHVIIWSKSPPGNCRPISTDPFVSPIAWSVCAASRSGAPGAVHITIIDLSPLDHATELLNSAVAILREESIPWLRIVPWRALVKDDVKTVRGALVSEPANGELKDREPNVALDQLRQTLRLKLTDPADPDNRHAISNLVGPMLLLGRRPAAFEADGAIDGINVTDHVAALDRVLGACGLLSTSGEAVGDSKESVRQWQQLSLPRKTRLILLDDQWHHGWGEWVCTVVGARFKSVPSLSPKPQKVSMDGAVEVFVAHDPNWLVERLTLVDGETDKRFRLRLLDSTDDVKEILLLDLRLFSSELKREQEFIKKLLPLCKKFTRNCHAWPSFDQSELDLITQWCDQDTSSSDVITRSARTLLGRLIALTDFSMPIVLFSSTGDRQFVEPMVPFGNILGSFSKPRYFGLSGQFDNEKVIRELIATLEVAGEILEVRRFLSEVSSTGHSVLQTVNKFLIKDGHDPSKQRYAELYVDETGSPVKYVGGYAVLYEDAETSPNKLYDALKDADLIWGASREEKPEDLEERKWHQRPTQAKAKDVKDTFELEERVNKTGKVLAGIGPFAGFLLGIPKSGSEACLPGGPDVAYRGVTAALTELFLYDWLPVISSVVNNSLMAGVFIATREWWQENMEKLIDCQWKYGCELRARHSKPSAANADMVRLDDISFEDQLKIGYPYWNEKKREGLVPVNRLGRKPSRDRRKVLAKTMSSFGAYEIVVGIARQRNRPAPVLRAVGVTMRDGVHEDRGDRPNLPRQIHYGSDDLLGLMGRKNRRQIEGSLPAPFRLGFCGIANEKLEILLGASRALDASERLVEALDLLADVWVSQELRPITRWVMFRAAQQLKAMAGVELLQLLKVRSWKLRQTEVAAPDAGTDNRRFATASEGEMVIGDLPLI